MEQWLVLCIAVLAALFIGVVLTLVVHRKAQKKKLTIKGVTEFLYVTTQISALLWVSLSYVIALYGTIQYGTVYPVESLSEQAIIAILGVAVAKTVGNIFEHNDGKVFGTSHKEEDTDEDVKG